MRSLYCSLLLVWVLIIEKCNAFELIDVEDITRMDLNESVNERIIQITSRNEFDTKNVYFDGQSLPTYFDARNRWPSCRSIGQIYNQGSCKSGWAIAIASVITDRMCIKSNSTTQEIMSAYNLLACCENCCGCNGGKILKGWKYTMKQGLLTGGGFNSKLGCQPYMIRPCDGRNNKWDDCSWKSDLVPRCSPSRCSNIKYAKIYKFGLKHRIQNYFLLPRANPDVIMKEIYHNGPLQVSMHLYDDFRWYKGGVYRHESGHFDGDHAVKLIGWDEHDNWILINSFGQQWGNKGTFLISREHQLSNCDFGYVIVAPILMS